MTLDDLPCVIVVFPDHTYLLFDLNYSSALRYMSCHMVVTLVRHIEVCYDTWVVSAVSFWPWVNLALYV